MTSELHDKPTPAELVSAVREFLLGDVRAALDPLLAYRTLVAANALGIVERQLDLGPAQERSYLDALEELGYADNRELAAAIRSGRADHHEPAVKAVLRVAVLDKLQVANPSYASHLSREPFAASEEEHRQS
jgi:hypothetical protein